DIRGAALVSAWMTTAGSSRFDGSKMAGSINKIDHLGCRMDRQRMMGDARSWRDKSRHFTSKIKLPIGRFREQRDHQILQRDHANAKLHNLSVCQLRNFGLRFRGNLSLLWATGSRAALIVPPRKCRLALLRRVERVWLPIRHKTGS